jgi:protein TonB
MGKNLRFVVFVVVAALSMPIPSGENQPGSATVCPRIANQGRDDLDRNATSDLSGLQEAEKQVEKKGIVELGDVKPPKLIKSVTPRYPQNALRQGIQGVVIIEATTDLEGRVTSTRVLKSVPRLDQAAVKAVKQWVYEPVVINGRPRRIVFTVTVRFSLSYGRTNDALADIQPPKLLRRVDPVYPQEAKKAGLEGTVVLGATIDGNGQVTEVKVLESVPGLDQAAIDALKQWLYAPVWVNNQPVIYTFTVSVRFTLK